MVAVAVSSITAGFPHVGPQGRALDHSPVPRGGLVLGTDSLSELIVVLGDEGGVPSNFSYKYSQGSKLYAKCIKH